MNQSKTIIINVFATHLRSFYALAVGLVTGRWMLMSLGHEAYGLFGLVGGLIVFVSIFNRAFSSAIMRYFAVAIGMTNDKKNERGVCREWFSISLFMIAAVSIFMLVISYPIGQWIICYFLDIPKDRVDDCVWVFRFSCLTCFIGFMNVPFYAMYIAKQNIAELTIYSFFQTTAHLLVLWGFVRNEGDWLVPMAIWWCVQQSLPRLIQMIRAFFIFEECRIVFRTLIDYKRMRELCRFAWWQLLGMIGDVFRVQGASILINKYLGPAFNATGTMATTISGHSQAFSNEVDGVFAPAITTAFGANDKRSVENLVMQCCKYSALLILFIVVPLSIEMDYLITWWLADPPPMMVPLTICLCYMMFINKLTSGHVAAINASGKIVAMQLCAFFCRIGIVVFAWIAFTYNYGIVCYGVASVTMSVVLLFSRIFIAKKNLLLSIKHWISKVLLPIIVIGGIGFLVGCIVSKNLQATFVRMLCVLFVTSLTMIVLTWTVGLRSDEKRIVLAKIKNKINR